MRTLGPKDVVGDGEFVLQKAKRIHEVRAQRRQSVHRNCDVLSSGKGLLQGSMSVRLRLGRIRPGEGESEGVEEVRREDMALLDGGVLICRAVESRPERNRLVNDPSANERSGVVDVASK